MKNLKRVLALIMVVALVFSLSVSALAFTDDAAITHNQAVNVLSELGVIKGYPDGSYRPADPVTRAEMAKMITVILNKGVDDPTQFESGVTDLTDISWNWGKSYITYCYLLNIIAGYGDGTFRPEDNVTVQEAAKMILVSLGFDVDQEGLEGVNWAVNANARANQYDIYSGVTQSVSEAATRDTIAQMLYNMLKANTVEYDVNIYTGISTMNKTEKALSKYFDCELLNGMIIANEYASLWDGVPLMAGRTEILYFNDDAIDNGIFDIAKGNYRYDELVSWVSDTLNVTTGQEELGLWVSVIRNQTTKKIVGNVMLNNEEMSIVEGGNGNFVDAIKAEGLRLVDGRFTIIVNSQIFTWEKAAATNYYLPTFAQHPLAIYSETEASALENKRSNAYLGTKLSDVLGTEFKDMNGMTFRAVELNGDNYIDVVYVETDTLTQITKVETKGGAKEYTFAGLNLSLNNNGTYSTITDYSPSAVKAADIVTEDTLDVEDYVLVTQVNETYYVSKVVFEDYEVSVKSATAKTLTLKDKDDSTTATYKLSNIPVANYITSNDELFTNDKASVSTLLSTVIGNTYTFGFDSAGNVVIAKEGEKKTNYALMNGMATTYGTNYTAQMFLEDGTTIEGGVDDFSINRSVTVSGSTYPITQDPRGSTPGNYTTNNNTGYDSASGLPALVSYKEDGTKYDILGEVTIYGAHNMTTPSTSALTGNSYPGASKTQMVIGGTTYTVTSNTVFFYRTVDKGNNDKVSYKAYTDYDKIPTFSNNSSIEVYAATVSDTATYDGLGAGTNAGVRLAAVFVNVADKSVITDPDSQDYIYISKVAEYRYKGVEQTMVEGFTIDKDGKVTRVTDFVFDDVYTSSIEGTLWTYNSTSTASVYKRGDQQQKAVVTGVTSTYLDYRYLNVAEDTYTGYGVSTYSSSTSYMIAKTTTGDYYDKLNGNFTNASNFKVDDVVYAINVPNSTNAAFVVRFPRTASTVDTDPDAGLISFNPIMINTNEARVSVNQTNMEISVLAFAGNASAIEIPVSKLNLGTGYRVRVTDDVDNGPWVTLASADDLEVDDGTGHATYGYVGVFDSNLVRVATYTINPTTYVGLSGTVASAFDSATTPAQITLGAASVIANTTNQAGTLTIYSSAPGSEAAVLATINLTSVVLDPTSAVVTGSGVAWSLTSGNGTITFSDPKAMGTASTQDATLTVTYNGVVKTYNIMVQGTAT